MTSFPLMLILHCVPSADGRRRPPYASRWRGTARLWGGQSPTMTRSSPLCEEIWTAWRRSSTSSRRITMRWDPCHGEGHVRHDQWVFTHQDNHFTSCQVQPCLNVGCLWNIAVSRSCMKASFLDLNVINIVRKPQNRNTFQFMFFSISNTLWNRLIQKGCSSLQKV